MCKHGDTVPLMVVVPARLAYEGVDTMKAKPIDRCIAPLVAALNAAGYPTIASCCGHGHRPGCIALVDGRELVIARDRDDARLIDGLFPLTIFGEGKPAPTDLVAG